MNIHFPSFMAVLVAIGIASLYFSPRSPTVEAFFRGRNEQGQPPGVWTLTFSQVTTWIFARSLLNAGILGYFFGIAGAIAYTAYYGSFLTGWLIVDRLRFHHGVDNVQTFLAQRFGRTGTGCYNALVFMRLLTEVFANLLVVGLVFSTWGETAGDIAILAVAGLTLIYSMNGGLRASLRTDVWQMLMLTALIVVLTFLMLLSDSFATAEILASSPDLTGPGWVLLVVALLQVLSYPLHDPVMMDRGFLADRDTTRRSFLHAFWVSALLILMFGLVGVFTGLHAAGEGDFLKGLDSLLGGPAMFAVGLALVLSAISTMDSTFSSVSKLVVMDAQWLAPTAKSGRIAMAAFAVLGLLLVYLGTDDLFAAVAVSGTASLFLTPVILFSIFGGYQVARWSLVATFVTAIGGSVLYFLENSGYTSLLARLTGLEHTYSHLLVITLVILALSMAFFALGLKPRNSVKSPL